MQMTNHRHQEPFFQRLSLPLHDTYPLVKSKERQVR